MIFPEITGHVKAKKILQRVFETKNIPHAWIFCGQEGSQNRETAHCFARLLLCETPTAEGACNQCSSCHLLNKESHPDFFSLKASGKIRTVKMEPVHDLLRFLSMKAYRNGFKVTIIEEADRLSVQAANTLLKSLEEPPEKTVFILCCRRESELLTTIVSRCQVLDFPPLSDEEMSIKINQIESLPLAPEVMLKLARGSVAILNKDKFELMLEKRNIALEILQDWLKRGSLGAIDGTEKILSHIDAESKILDKEIKETLKELKEVPKNIRDKKEESLIADKTGNLKSLLDDILDFLSIFFRDILFIRNNLPSSHLNNPDQYNTLLQAAQKHPDPEEAIKTLDLIRKRLNGTVNQRLTLENLLLNIFP